MQAVNRNGSIDVLRAVMAFVVIVNHTCIFGMKMQDLLDCAVPVFLIISGYYFHSTSMEEEKRKLRKAISKISYLFVGSVFLYVTWGGIKFLFFLLPLT